MSSLSLREFGAGNEVRTRDLNLGKVALYQLSYSRGKQGADYRSGLCKTQAAGSSPSESPVKRAARR
jgi:hypothetical protein